MRSRKAVLIILFIFILIIPSSSQSYSPYFLYRIKYDSNVNYKMVEQVNYSLKRYGLFRKLNKYYSVIYVKNQSDYFGLFYPGSHKIEVFDSYWYWNWYPESRNLTSEQLIWKVVYHEIGHGIQFYYQDRGYNYTIDKLKDEHANAKTFACVGDWGENFAEIFSDRLVGIYKVNRNEYRYTYYFINNVVLYQIY